MWRYDTSVKAEGIGKIPVFIEVVGEVISIIEVEGVKYQAFRVYHNDNEICFSIKWRNSDVGEMINCLLQLNPEKEFSICEYCEEGYSHTVKCGIFDGEYKEWDEKEHSIYDDIEELENELRDDENACLADDD